MRMIDGQMTVFLKSAQAEQYDEIYSYKIGDSTPLGYIHIWSSGRGNFALDNLKVTNLDTDANLKEVNYKAFVVENTGDWEYQPQEVVYLDKAENTTGFNWKMIVAGEVIVGIVVLTGSIVFAKVGGKRKKKEVLGNVQ